MIQLPPDFKEFLKLLNSTEVEYLVAEIDGIAVRNKQATGRIKDRLDLEELG